MSGDWRHSAACVEEDPELFFPIGITGAAIAQIEEAKAVCRTCTVVEECLRFALDTGQGSGVWGGLSEDERASYRRRTARAERAAVRSGVPAPVVPVVPQAAHLLDAGPVQDVVQAARARGLAYEHIVQQLGVSHSTARALGAGERKYVTQRVADAARRMAERLYGRVNA